MAGKGRWEKDGGWLSRTGPPRKVAMCFIHMESCLYQIVCPSSYWNSWPQTPSFPPLWILFFSLRVLSLWVLLVIQTELSLSGAFISGRVQCCFVLSSPFSLQSSMPVALLTSQWFQGFATPPRPADQVYSPSGSNEWAWNPSYYSKYLGVHIDNGGQVTARFK